MELELWINGKLEDTTRTRIPGPNGKMKNKGQQFIWVVYSLYLKVFEENTNVSYTFWF